MRSKLGLLSVRRRRRFVRLQFASQTVYDINCPHQLKTYLVKRSVSHKISLGDASLINLGETVSGEMGQSS